MPRRKGPSNVELSLSMLRRWGYTVGNVEKFISAIKIRVDLFGIIDLIAMGGDAELGIVGVQVCGLSDYQAHIRKYREEKLEDNIRRWLESGGRYSLHAWGEGKLHGDRITRVRISEAFTTNRGIRWEETEQQYHSRNPGKSKEDPI